MNKTILVVDDKVSVQRLVADYLSEHGFKVFAAGDGREAMFVARHEKPDLILLDIMMPNMDGYEFMRLHRRERNTPIILLTAKIEETDKVIGLEMGADDYITKPFGMSELVARVRALLRRIDNPPTLSDVIRAGDIALDTSARSVRVSDRFIDLTPSEFLLLETLMRTPGRVFSRTELLERLQGDSLTGVERTVDVHISNLRNKLEPDPGQPRYVVTVFGAGYRFNTVNTE